MRETKELEAKLAAMSLKTFPVSEPSYVEEIVPIPKQPDNTLTSQTKERIILPIFTIDGIDYFDKKAVAEITGFSISKLNDAVTRNNQFVIDNLAKQGFKIVSLRSLKLLVEHRNKLRKNVLYIYAKIKK